MATARRSDIKVLVIATTAVLIGGLFLGGLIYEGLGGGKSPICGMLNIGAIADIRKNLQDQGPGFQTGGGDCGFWLALDAGDVVAYKAKQPGNCTLHLRDQATRWECGGRTLTTDQLTQYPVKIETIAGIDAVIVDLRQPAPGSTVSSTPASGP